MPLANLALYAKMELGDILVHEWLNPTAEKVAAHFKAAGFKVFHNDMARSDNQSSNWAEDVVVIDPNYEDNETTIYLDVGEDHPDFQYGCYFQEGDDIDMANDKLPGMGTFTPTQAAKRVADRFSPLFKAHGIVPEKKKAPATPKTGAVEQTINKILVSLVLPVIFDQVAARLGLPRGTKPVMKGVEARVEGEKGSGTYISLKFSTSTGKLVLHGDMSGKKKAQTDCLLRMTPNGIAVALLGNLGFRSMGGTSMMSVRAAAFDDDAWDGLVIFHKRPGLFFGGS